MNNELRDSVVRQLTQSGIAAESIQSSKYSASPQYGWFGSAPSSFEVVNSLVVTVSEEPDFRRVAEIADQNESIAFGGVEFEHSQKDAYEDKVREKAVAAVMKDREFFEAQLGLKLTPVSFSFSDVDTPQPYAVGQIEEMVVTGSRGSSVSKRAAEPPPSFDEVEYRVTVAVLFEVEQPE